MTLEVASGARLGADEAMTADRSELTYLVPHGDRHGLVQLFNGCLPPHRYLGQAEGSRSAPQHFVTTVYFDTLTRRLLQAARSHPRENTKLRAKEYYDVHPGSAELATLAEDAVHAPGQLWLELKRRSGARTQKHRVRLSKSTLERWLAERSELRRLEYVGQEADARVLQQYLDAEAEPLSPAYLVNYQRCPWQSEDGQLRLTLDSDLAAFAPPADLFRLGSLLRESLGSACAREGRALLEVKYRDAALPSWLVSRLAQLGLSPVDHSKFVLAGAAVEPDRVG